jgi:hypothetical protein
MVSPSGVFTVKDCVGLEFLRSPPRLSVAGSVVVTIVLSLVLSLHHQGSILFRWCLWWSYDLFVLSYFDSYLI